LRLILVSVAAFFVFAWDKLTTQHLHYNEKKETVLPVNKNKLVVFDNSYIIVNQNGDTTVLSAHCTHLGCIINQTEDGKLVCPCHGSEYDLSGKVIKGPAYKNLKIIPSEITPDGKHIEING